MHLYAYLANNWDCLTKFLAFWCLILWTQLLIILVFRDVAELLQARNLQNSTIGITWIQGSSRTPLRPGGGVTFGPKPRDWSHKMNKKEKRLAISSALQSAAVDMTIVEDIDDKVGLISLPFLRQTHQWMWFQALPWYKYAVFGAKDIWNGCSTGKMGCQRRWQGPTDYNGNGIRSFEECHAVCAQYPILDSHWCSSYQYLRHFKGIRDTFEYYPCSFLVIIESLVNYPF